MCYDAMHDEMDADNSNQMLKSAHCSSESSPQNSNNSLLLNLPAEPRNEIFRNVFHGLVTQIYVIHEHFDLLDKGYKVFGVPRADVGIINDHGHLKCPPHPLALLETCRQIQRETTALAFSMIDFELSGYSVMDSSPPCLDFLDRLSNEKRAAIATLKIDGMNPFNYGGIEKAEGLFKKIMGQLPSLKRIAVLMEHHDEDFDKDPDEDAGDTDAQAFLVRDIAILQKMGQHICD